MIIRSVNRKYLVIGDLAGNGEVCLCEREEDHRRCLVIRIREPRVIAAAVEFLYEQAENRAFADFEDCFVNEESLLVVFAYPGGRGLAEKLRREYCSIGERLEIMKHVLERIILLDMPPFFAAHCLELPNICVRPGLDISFRYEITDVEHCRDYSLREVRERLRELTAFVFAEELKKEVLEPVADFLEVLGRGEVESPPHVRSAEYAESPLHVRSAEYAESPLHVRSAEYAESPPHIRSAECYDGYLELYRGFLAVREQVLALSEQELNVPRTWIFRMWDKVRKLFKPLKRLLTAAALIAGLLYMLWTIDHAARPAASADVVERIGTLEIQ